MNKQTYHLRKSMPFEPTCSFLHDHLELYLYSIIFCKLTKNMYFYYPTAPRRVKITPKTSTNIAWYLYSRGPVRQVCLLLTNQLAGFPTPIPFRFAYFCRTFPVNIRKIRPHGHKTLTYWIINLLLDVLLCSIAENFYSSFVF